MASPKAEVFQVRDLTTDAPVTGRVMGAGGFVFSYYSDDTGVSVTPPTVTEIGGGFYKFIPTLPSNTSRALVYDLNLGTNANPTRITRYVRPEDWNADGIGSIATVQFTAGGETVSPSISSIASTVRTGLIITFSENVRMTADSSGALNIANYAISGGITVSAARALAPNQVALTTSLMTPGTNYTITVSNVVDLNGNPIL